MLAVAALIAIGLFPHFYRFEQSLYYFDDQSGLLYKAHEILFHHFVPRVGSIMSVPGVNTPPASYYMMARLELLGSKPLIVTSLYMVLGTISCLLLFWSGGTIFDAEVGVIMLGLLMTSWSFIEHTTNIKNIQEVCYNKRYNI